MCAKYTRLGQLVRKFGVPSRYCLTGTQLWWNFLPKEVGHNGHTVSTLLGLCFIQCAIVLKIGSGSPAVEYKPL